MADLYTRYPTVSHTLKEFNRRVKRFLEEEDSASFIRAVLTGGYNDEDDGLPRQIFIDTMQNMVEDNHGLRLFRDYDSLNGVADKIMVDGSINIFSIPHSTFALKKSIHFKHEIVYNGVSGPFYKCITVPKNIISRLHIMSTIIRYLTSSSGPLAQGNICTSSSQVSGLLRAPLFRSPTN